jgi:hypothetical protein
MPNRSADEATHPHGAQTRKPASDINQWIRADTPSRLGLQSGKALTVLDGWEEESSLPAGKR